MRLKIKLRLIFFNEFLPKHLLVELDLETLVVNQEAHLGDDLRSIFSDLVFTIGLKNKIKKCFTKCKIFIYLHYGIIEN